MRQPGAAAAAATGKEAKRLSDNKPFKIAAAEAAVSGSPSGLQSTVLSLIGRSMASRKKNTPAVQQTSPVVESEQTCQVEKVECPPELGPIAREEWDKVAPHLVAAGRLKPLDRSSHAVYCAAYATWLEASQTARSWQAFTGRQESAACSAALLYSGAPSGRRHCHR